MASELVTNAVLHGSPSGEYIVTRTYLGNDGMPVIEVWDESPQHPRINVSDPDD